MLVTLILVSNFRKYFHSTKEKANNVELIEALNYFEKSQEMPNEMDALGYTMEKKNREVARKKEEDYAI